MAQKITVHGTTKSLLIDWKIKQPKKSSNSWKLNCVFKCEGKNGCKCCFSSIIIKKHSFFFYIFVCFGLLIRFIKYWNSPKWLKSWSQQPFFWLMLLLLAAPFYLWWLLLYLCGNISFDIACATATTSQGIHFQEGYSGGGFFYFILKRLCALSLSCVHVYFNGFKLLRATHGSFEQERKSEWVSEVIARFHK